MKKEWYTTCGRDDDGFLFLECQFLEDCSDEAGFSCASSAMNDRDARRQCSSDRVSLVVIHLGVHVTEVRIGVQRGTRASKMRK